MTEHLATLNNLVDEIRELVASNKDPSKIYVGLEHIDSGTLELHSFASGDTSKSANLIFRSGDVLFGKLRPGLKKVVQVEVDGYCSTEILILRSRPEVHSRFAAWVMNSAGVFRKAEESTEETRMPRTSWARLKTHPVYLPDLVQQRRIAEILDAADGQLAAVQRVLAKKRYIEFALAGRMWHKPSTGGTTRPLSEVASISAGLTLGSEPSGPDSVEFPYLRVANVQDGFIDTSEMKTARVLRSEIERYAVRPGDVLLTEGGDFDKLGRGAMWDGHISPCLHQNHIFRVRCRRNAILPEFLASYMSSPTGRRYFLNIAKQTTNLASINSTQLKVMPVPVPSVEEQLRLLGPLLMARSESANQEAELNKLKLLKQGLMEDLLTGKVRVTCSGELTG